MANLNHSETVRFGEQEPTTVERREVLLDHTWNRAKTIMFGLGGLALLGWLVWFGWWFGGSGCNTCIQNQPKPSVVIPVTAPKPADPVAEQIKALTAVVEKLASTPAPVPAAAPAPLAPQASASATASAAATSQSAPPQTLIIRVEREPAPRPRVQENPAPKPVEPCANQIASEVRRCEIWAPLNQR